MIKSRLIIPFARYVAKQVDNQRKHAVQDQKRVFQKLIKKGSFTRFGKDHEFEGIHSHDDFVERVPLRDYEQGRTYFDALVRGEMDVLWPGRPAYFAKTSGTTSGTKYIPITRDSMPNHLNTARTALLNYAALPGKSKLFDGKVMFLSGSPTMTETNGIPTGRLSGIVNHEIPAWIKGNQLPSFKTNCVKNWEEKVDLIVEETYDKDLRLISGIPPWVQMYFERLLERTGKSNILEVFKNLQLFMYGGVNYEPYRHAMEELMGGSIDTIETFPASEGFIAFQDMVDDSGLLLNSNSGIFFEFVPLQEVFEERPTRLTLEQVSLDTDYAVILSNNAGLWAYNLGDTVRFVNLDPYRLIVSGRIKHFISAFGEHVIAKEVEESIQSAMIEFNCKIKEFTVAPQVTPKHGLPFHEWFIEFEDTPEDLTPIASYMDQKLRAQNIYYDDLIKGGILKPLEIKPLQKNAFRSMMKDQGKLGGQNKVPRLSNDRKIANQLDPFIMS